MRPAGPAGNHQKRTRSHLSCLLRAREAARIGRHHQLVPATTRLRLSTQGCLVVMQKSSVNLNAYKKSCRAGQLVASLHSLLATSTSSRLITAQRNIKLNPLIVVQGTPPAVGSIRISGVASWPDASPRSCIRTLYSDATDITSRTSTPQQGPQRFRREFSGKSAAMFPQAKTPWPGSGESRQNVAPVDEELISSPIYPARPDHFFGGLPTPMSGLAWNRRRARVRIFAAVACRCFACHFPKRSPATR